MASAVYFCDLRGKPLLARRYRDDISPHAIDRFAAILQEEGESSALGDASLADPSAPMQFAPVIERYGLQYMFVRHHDLYVVAIATVQTVDVFMIIGFCYKVLEVLSDYLHDVTEESIRDNFVVIYELMDEVMDYGIPQFTETKMLKKYITQKSNKLIKLPKSKAKRKNVIRPPEQLTNSVNWRPEGIKYKKNEAYLDIIESVNMLLTHNGKALRSEIIGVVKVKSRLSGMPDLKLGINDKGIFSKYLAEASTESKPTMDNSAVPETEDVDDDNGVDQKHTTKAMQLEDLKFHQCVRLSKFENEKIITFIPPDGEFDLMSYRINATLKPLIWCDVDIRVHSQSRIEIHCRAKAQFKKKATATNVEILIPVPEDADTPVFRHSHGSLKWVPQESAVLWKIRSFPGGKEYTMAAELQLPSIVSDNKKPKSKRPVQVKFQIPFSTSSGIKVRYLKINEPKLQYKSYPWVRYITKNGDDYTIRI